MSDIYELLIQEMAYLPYGFEKEVYYTKERGLTFSECMTPNAWTMEKNCVGRISSLPWGDLECFNNLDDEYVEIDDQCNERPRGVKRSQYELEWARSSIVKMDEALERIACVYEDTEAFKDITDEIDRIDEGVKTE